MLDNENNKNKKIFILPIAIILIMLFSIYPSIVYAEETIWYRQSNTIVLQNSTENVYIGENSTTAYKLRVNGSFYANSLFGDGGNLTNVTSSFILPSYLNDIGHPHNQDLNTSNNVTFNNIISDANISLNGVDSTHRFNIGDISTNRYGFLGYDNPLRAITLYGIRSVDSIDLDVSSSGVGLLIIPDFKLDSIGAVTLSKQPATRVRLLNSQSVPNNLNTKMNLTVNDYDLNNDWNDINNRFIVPVTGLYQISFSVMAISMPDQTTLKGMIYKNGVLAGGYASAQVSSTISNTFAISGSDILQLAVNDYIELYVWQNSGSAWNFLNVATSNYLAICKIA